MTEEAKRLNFKRIAEARTEKILNMIDLLGNLANTSFYSYSEKDIETIFNAIQETLNESKKKFSKKSKFKRRKHRK